MNDQQTKGTLAKARGSIETFLGRLTGNRRQQAAGAVHTTEGNVRQAVGDIQRSVERPADPEPPRA